MDCLSPSHPAREVTAKKGAQLGFTDAGLNLIGTVIDTDPMNILVLLPTDGEVRKYNRTKLSLAIAASPALERKVRPERSRSERGSTTASKLYPGGELLLTGATSSAGLQMISARYIVFEEISEYPEDAGGRGDPVDQALKRTDAWAEERKVFNNSTPKAKGRCRVSKRYNVSDQRRYYVPCPHCGCFFVLKTEHLRWNETRERPPFGEEMICPSNGCVIQHHHKRAMMLAVPGWRWIKTFRDSLGVEAPPFFPPEDFARWRDRDSEGRHPGFAIGQLYSPFKSWGTIVQEDIDSRGDLRKRKTFVQQVLGDEWDEGGEAPPAEELYARREHFEPFRIPATCLVLTAGADVQPDRIELELVAWNPRLETWSIGYEIFTGNTALPDVWLKLDEFCARRFEDARGQIWPIDMVAIDSGYQTKWVYRWVSQHRGRAMATKGANTLDAPYLALGKKQIITFSGRRIGVAPWMVGTNKFKSDLYSYLGLTGPDATGAYPPGFAHFPTHYGESYFSQLTAEQKIETTVRGQPVHRWEVKPGVRNEALDCRVGNMAAAERLGIFYWNADRWNARAAERNAPQIVGTDGLPLFGRAAAEAAAAGDKTKDTATRGDLAALFGNGGDAGSIQG